MVTFSLAICLLICSIQHVIGNTYILPFFDCSGQSKTHYDFGFCIGNNTKDQITNRWNKWTTVKNLYQYLQTPDGAQLYESFLATNKNRFPSYIDEIQGMADASSFTFQQLFTMTCADEIGYFAPHSSPQISCSDYILHNYDDKNNLIGSYIAHNEDNSASVNANNTFLVYGGVDNEEPRFYSYGYAGELLTQASGWNNFIIFTANYVKPNNPISGGLCRNFIARAMLVQKTLNETLIASSLDGQCSGHNYQIGEWLTGNSVDSEVAYKGLHAFTFVDTDTQYLFHANMYIHLNISQPTSQSSINRQNEAKKLGKPSDLNAMLDDLGNAAIYSNSGTFHTMGIDILNGVITIYQDNPTEHHVLLNCGVSPQEQTSFCRYK